MKYQIQDIAIDTKDIESGLYDLILSNKSAKYLYTEIGYNNDYILRDSKKKIISALESLEEWEILLKYHTQTLGVDKIDILLFKSTDPVGIREAGKGYKVLYNEVGLAHPKTVDDLEKFRESFGKYPDYVSLRINPMSYPLDIIRFCTSKNIHIIADGIFGTPEVFSNWGCEFLLAFASCHADIVLATTYYGYEKFFYYTQILDIYKEEQINMTEYHLLFPEKNISRELINDRNPGIFLYMNFDEFTVNIGHPTSHPVIDKDLYFLSSINDKEFITTNARTSKIERAVHQALDEKLEGRKMVSEEEVRAFGRYVSTHIIRSLLSNIKKIRLEYTRVGNLFIIKAAHKWFWWLKRSFILSIRYTPETGSYRVFFLEKRD